ncbi:MAG: hypothetical protein AB7O53_17185 [Thermoleophilia bacterium]
MSRRRAILSALLALVIAGGALAVGTGTAAAARPSLASAKLGPDGLGPVRIGMTEVQARTATRSRLKVTQRSGSCAVLSASGRGVQPGIYFLLTDGVVRRATVALTPTVNLVNLTTKGLRLSSPDSEVRRIYGRPVLAARNPSSGGVDLVYKPRPKAFPQRRYVFSTGSFGGLNGRYVTAMSVGEMPEARYSEACS